jgi:hypothetical protein
LPRVDLSSTFYLLNPDGDLKETQETFRDWFVKELKWQASVVLQVKYHVSPWSMHFDTTSST